MNVLDQIDQIKSEARENFLAKREDQIRQIAQRIKGKSKPSFSSVIHALAEKEDSRVEIAQSIDNLIDLNIQNDSDFSNQDFSQAFG
jgi:hypothetical protein